MNRTVWIDRLCDVLDRLEESALSTEQLAALAVTLETFMAPSMANPAPVLTLVPSTDRSTAS